MWFSLVYVALEAGAGPRGSAPSSIADDPSLATQTARRRFSRVRGGLHGPVGYYLDRVQLLVTRSWPVPNKGTEQERT